MGHLHFTVTEFDGRLFKVFATIGKSGKSTTVKTDDISRVLEKCYGRNARRGNTNARKEERCPECSSSLSHEEGGMTCHSRGHTLCR